MKRTSYHDTLIRAELDSHVLDCVDDLLAEGYATAEAKKIAQERFGNIDDIANEVHLIDRPVFNTKFSPLTIATVLYSVLVLLLYLGITIVPLPVINDYAQLALFWWAELGVIGVTLLVDYWILQYTGLNSTIGAWAIFLFTLLQNICLTTILDIDHFEVVLHNLALVLLYSLVVLFFWQRLGLFWRKTILYSSGVITTAMIFTNHRLFEWLYRAKCLFITPDAITLTGCTQVTWFHPLLWPIYLVLASGIVFFGCGLVHYWQNSAITRLRKTNVTIIFVALLVIPWLVHDINNQAELDIIPWKHQINQAYREILGRDPEAKDMDFYASSRAFEHMSRVRNTLYTSAERKIKMNQLYQQLLHRDATAEEIDWHNRNQTSIGALHLLH